jgi:hypothetical protein
LKAFIEINISNWLRIFVSFILLISSNTQSVFGQDYFGEEANAVFSDLYQFQMLSADTTVNREISSQPDSALWNLLSANVAWMEILAGNLEDPYWNGQFKERIKKAKRNLKREGLDQDDKLFYYIIVHAFKTRHELLNENYLNAASDLNTCIDQISESFGREGDYEPFYLTSGLYYYFMAKAYDEYILMRPYLMFYPDGDLEKGLSYLIRLTKSKDVFLKNESNYFLMRIFHDLEDDQERALGFAKNLVNQNPNNLIYRLYYIKILRKLDSPSIGREVQLYKEKVNSSSQISPSQRTHFLNELKKEN